MISGGGEMGSSLPDAEELARQGLELTHFTEENKTTLRTTWHILYSKVLQGDPSG